MTDSYPAARPPSSPPTSQDAGTQLPSRRNEEG